MPKVNLSVSIEDQHLDRVEEVVKRVKRAGMSVEEVMEGVGIVTGSIEPEKLDSLRGVAGVAHVEASRHFSIAPPESDVQ